MDKKFVLITGGTSGIGLSTIRKFLSELKSDVEISYSAESIYKLFSPRSIFKACPATLQINFFFSSCIF